MAVIEINSFSPEHGEGVAAMILPIQQVEFGFPITLDDQPDLLDIPGFYQQGKGNFWVALSGREVVGTISLKDIGNGQAALRKMFVSAEFRGAAHGVAQHLLNTLFDWGRAHAIDEVYLGTTAKFLAAHRFYEKNGFLEIQKTMLPTAFPLMSLDTKFYRKSS